MELFDLGLSPEAIAEQLGSPLERVKNQLSYMGAHGTDASAKRHFNDIRKGSAMLLERLIAVHGVPKNSQPPAKEMAQ